MAYCRWIIIQLKRILLTIIDYQTPQYDYVYLCVFVHQFDKKYKYECTMNVIN